MSIGMTFAAGSGLAYSGAVAYLAADSSDAHIYGTVAVVQSGATKTDLARGDTLVDSFTGTAP